MSDKNKTVKADFQVKNTLGIHARPASLFVQMASGFESEISVEKDGETVNGKSLMGMLMLSAGCGSTIKVSVKGSDAEEVVRAIGQLIDRKFDEE